jgi:ParB/RepB/Spo0J family partition protein
MSVESMPISMNVQTIAVDLLDMDEPNGTDRTFSKEHVEDLAASIKSEGLIHPPTVTPVPGTPDRFKVIAGKHRAYACRNLLKWEEIPCRVVEGVDAEYQQAIADAENLWRLPLDDAQRDRALRRWYAVYQKKYPNASGSGAHNKGDVERDNGRFVPPTDAKDLASAELNPPPFSKVVQQALGVSASTAQRQTRRAKNLTQKQADALRKAHVTDTDIDAVAALGNKTQIAAAVKVIAKGTAPEEAIRQAKANAAPKPEPKVAGSSKKTSEIKKQEEEEKQAPAEKTDEQWLEEYCPRVIRGMKSSVRYKRDAVLFRRIYKAVCAFRASVKKAVAEAKYADGNGFFFSTVYRLLKCKHPGEWVVCGVCEGSTRNPENPKDWCKGCAGGGYKLTMEDG